MKKQLKNMDIRKAVEDAGLKLSDLARMMCMEPQNFYHWLLYCERSKSEKAEMMRLIKKHQLEDDQVLAIARILNMPNKEPGFYVVRLNRSKMWYYGNYETEERAQNVAFEVGGLVLEVE